MALGRPLHANDMAQEGLGVAENRGLGEECKPVHSGRSVDRPIAIGDVIAGRQPLGILPKQMKADQQTGIEQKLSEGSPLHEAARGSLDWL